MEKLCINEWPEEDRPREKLLAQGASALTDAELLAILVGSGSPRETALQLMQRLLNDCQKSLKRLGRRSLEELCAYNGIGPAKAVTIMAACELGKRRANEPPEKRRRLDTADAIYRYMLHARMQDLLHEECHALLLDQRLGLIGTHLVSKGGLTDAAVDVRCVLREALVQRAPAVVLCHNHPSGSSSPSAADDRLTERLREACAAVNVRLVDHIIVADGNYYSYAENGKL